MMENFRNFQAGPDPSGRTWQVEFAWLQTGIAIRHSDSVDVKFLLSDGSSAREKIIALPHPALLAQSRQTGKALSDPWCARLAALHLKNMVETGVDMEKTLIELSTDQVQAYDAML